MKALLILTIGAIFALYPQPSLAQSTPSPAPTAAPVPAVPKDTPLFAAPPGWLPKQVTMAMSNFTMLQMWMAPSTLSAGDNLGLGFVEAPPGSSLTDVVHVLDATYSKLFGSGNPIASHSERLCGGKSDGWYYENKVTFGALNVISEQTVIVGPYDLFEATYTRLSSEPEDAAARASLDSLCVKPSASPA